MFKDILVHLDEGPRRETRLRVAVDLARRHKAHLTALFVVDVPGSDLFYGTGMPFAGSSFDHVVSDMRTDRARRADAIGEEFRDTLRKEGLEGEWRVIEGDTADILVQNARYSDLTVLGQPDDSVPFTGPSADSVLVNVLMASGRPLLAIPYAGSFSHVGSHVLVAWNATRESARAVNDAVPLLRGAAKVTVLSVNPPRSTDGQGAIPCADIALHLARHGIAAEAAHTVALDISEGEVLLSYAADLGADLIVAGGYGHSRVREMMFGGVTRTLLREMTVPMFMSH